MSTMALADLATRMIDIDFAMLLTRGANGAIAGRPMSNNGDVEYNGDSYFFTFEESHTVADIKRDAVVSLSFAGAKGLLGKRPLFIALEGRAELIHDKGAFAEHWTKGLDHWFKNGIDTLGIVLIKVRAARIHYWDGEEDGEVTI